MFATASTHPWELIGPAIAAARRVAGRSQQELAVTLGVRVATVSDWERAVQRPSVETLRSIEETLGLRLGHFLRIGGFIEDDLTTEAVIAADPRLEPEQAQLLLVALRSFIRRHHHE